MSEIWKDIVGYEGLYQVSNLGKIKSTRYDKEIVLKPAVSKDGYCQVVLYNFSKRSVLVHRMVAISFLDNPNLLPSVNHKDENKQNNCVENLEWCTVLYNNNYGIRNLKIKINHSISIIATDVLTGKETFFASTIEASKFGFDNSCITKCCLKKRNTHKGFYWRYAL